MSYHKPPELRYGKSTHISTAQIECFMSKLDALYSSIRHVVAERLPNIVINAYYVFIPCR